MKRAGAIIAVALATSLLPAPASAHPLEPAERAPAPQYDAAADAAPARLLDGMGNYRFGISSKDPLAQRYFDQGLVLAWGFNFAEAGRSFREAARLDPDCAICWWGAAYALGPSINHDMDATALAAARSDAQRAARLAPHTSAKERALIAALAMRYPPATGRGHGPRDAAYAKAMRRVALQFPGDADVLTLLADALMIPHGRDYWQKTGAPRPWTTEILKLLEGALEIAPDHPGANHYYIHALEDSPHPERARASAQRLQTLAPGVAHLVHMPAHVLLRLGDYAGAARANQNAIAADRAYLAGGGADPAYLAGYAEHNHHFLWYASIMSGDSKLALAAAAELARYAESAAAGSPGTGTQQHFLVLPLYTQVRFGRWQVILAASRPAAQTAYTDGVWHYARGMAMLRTGQPERAIEELERLNEILRRAAHDPAALKNVIPLSRLLAIAARQLQAELAGAGGKRARAVEQARAAVRMESALETDEPPAWHMPARHTLGALLLGAERAADAEQVYREDLRIHPENGWALAGLAASLARQGRDGAAAEARERFQQAWAAADVVLSGSRY